jgi:hypothetical protein
MLDQLPGGMLRVRPLLLCCRRGAPRPWLPAAAVAAAAAV